MSHFLLLSGKEKKIKRLKSTRVNDAFTPLMDRVATWRSHQREQKWITCGLVASSKQQQRLPTPPLLRGSINESVEMQRRHEDSFSLSELIDYELFSRCAELAALPGFPADWRTAKTLCVRKKERKIAVGVVTSCSISWRMLQKTVIDWLINYWTLNSREGCITLTEVMAPQKTDTQRDE